MKNYDSAQKSTESRHLPTDRTETEEIRGPEPAARKRKPPLPLPWRFALLADLISGDEGEKLGRVALRMVRIEGVPTRAYCPDHAREPVGPLEQEVLDLLAPVDMQSPDDVTNAIARLARELDERAGPILGKPAETEREVVYLPACGGEAGSGWTIGETAVRGHYWDGSSVFLHREDGTWWCAGQRVESPTGRLFGPLPQELIRRVESHDADPRDRETTRQILEPADGDVLAAEALAGFEVLRKDPRFDVQGARTWRPLAEGDVIREGDKIRDAEGKPVTGVDAALRLLREEGLGEAGEIHNAPRWEIFR